MPAPLVSDLPAPPLRSDSPSTFTSRAEAFVEALVDFVPEVNALAAYLEALESGTLDADLAAIAALATTAYGRALLTLADAAAARTALGLANAAMALPLTFNFSAAGEARFYADVAMTLTQQATSGVGTIDYEKSTAAAPSSFSATASPISLEVGAWLKVKATSVTGLVATHLKRTA